MQPASPASKTAAKRPRHRGFNLVDMLVMFILPLLLVCSIENMPAVYSRRRRPSSRGKVNSRPATSAMHPSGMGAAGRSGRGPLFRAGEGQLGTSTRTA